MPGLFHRTHDSAEGDYAVFDIDGNGRILQTLVLEERGLDRTKDGYVGRARLESLLERAHSVPLFPPVLA